MVITQIPPIWTDRDSCFRCRTTFSAFTRKHHCRACGETFCSACSSKQSSIREYGIEDEVRVCESCYERITTTGSVRPPTSSSSSSSLSMNKPRGKSQAEIDEEDALQLAISLSQSEAEEKERKKKFLTQQYALSNIQFPSTPIGSAPVADQVACHCQSSGVLSKTSVDLHLTKDDNEQKTGGGTNELAKYLDRNQWEIPREKDQTQQQQQDDPLDQYVRDEQIDAFISSVTEHINNIKFRMLSNQQRGRNIANDTAVQSVFIILQHMYPELHRLIKSLDDKQAYYEGLQDKLGQLKDAREALNALREEHTENKRRQALERERQRQIQLAVKLDDMRQKKQAYLEYQRQIHLQRLAEQEAEMQARLDQQRRYTQQREQQNQYDYRLNQIPFVQSTTPSSMNFYPPTAPNQSASSYPYSMTPLSDALPPGMIQMPSAPQLYTSYPPVASAPTSTLQSNEQTLISFD